MPIEIRAWDLRNASDDEVAAFNRCSNKMRAERLPDDRPVPVEETLQAVKLIDGRVETESSGGITRDSIRTYAECGVDYISVGALTHQISSLDLSLKADF